MILRTIAIEIYADQTTASTAAARMRLPPESMTDVMIKEANKRVIYDNFVLDTEEITLADDGTSLWLVLGSK
jgi:hypothetical protein